jgi:hypothetical protein
MVPIPPDLFLEDERRIIDLFDLFYQNRRGLLFFLLFKNLK